ncbi:MAG: lipoyl synthase [Candidatus Thermoplasmatota archaeon]|nr:lipoyl synthase [Candidatus Thermoplasmatota archaeon]
MHPDYVKVKLPTEAAFFDTKKEVKGLNLHTVCEEARCPNRSECWSDGTATFMVLGKNCSRNCGFCSVTHGYVQPLDPMEPFNVATAARDMGLKYVVITSVDRDDLPDQGSKHFASVIREVRKTGASVEVLIPDFRGDKECIDRILDEGPVVLAHNVETVRRLSPSVRDHRANYDQSLEVLRYAAMKGFVTKSSIMLGFGESDDEVIETMKDLRKVDVSILTIGQYLRPSKMQLPVVEYCRLARFERLKEIGYELGFQFVASGPLVRTSYKAAEAWAMRRLH